MTTDQAALRREQKIRERMHAVYQEYVQLEGELSQLDADRFRVCIFGSARIQPTDPTYRMVRRIARTLARLGIDIVTGGGPGLMEAANEGERQAHNDDSYSIGLPILLHRVKEAPNCHLDIKDEHSRFSTRLDEFMRLSHAVIVAPGGIGTLLELMYTWQLIQVKLIEPRAFVLLGSEFWEGLLQWMRDQQVRRAFINPSDMDFVHLADTPAEVLELIRPELEKFRAQRRDAGDHPRAETASAMIAGARKLEDTGYHREPLPGTERGSGAKR